MTAGGPRKGAGRPAIEGLTTLHVAIRAEQKTALKALAAARQESLAQTVRDIFDQSVDIQNRAIFERGNK